MKPSPEEIRSEADAIRARRLKDIPKRQLHLEMEAMIDALTGNLDPTSGEFNELSEGEQNAATDALNWMEGLTKRRPSEVI